MSRMTAAETSRLRARIREPKHRHALLAFASAYMEPKIKAVTEVLSTDAVKGFNPQRHALICRVSFLAGLQAGLEYMQTPPPGLAALARRLAKTRSIKKG